MWRVLVATVILLAGSGREAWAWKGRGYLAFDRQAAVARAETAERQPSVRSGWDFRFGGGVHGIPLTLGLGGGALVYSTQSFKGPTGVFTSGGEVGFGPTTVVRTTEMRHVDLLVRLEPEWRFIRPFVEGTIGTAQFFTSHHLSTDWQGFTVDQQERGDMLAFAWGWAVGLNIEPTRLYSGPRGSLGLAVSIGLRSFSSTPLQFSLPIPDDADGRLLRMRAPLDVMAPFLGLAIVSRSPG